jgi:hypothetical protein
MGCRVHYAESHANKAALQGRALALGIELDRAAIELKSIKPDDPTFVELDGWRPSFSTSFVASTLPFHPFPSGTVFRSGVRVCALIEEVQ